MNNQEVTLQRGRIEKYDKLMAMYDKTREALEAVTQDNPKGPCGSGPFTGNVRESRDVSGLIIHFTRTKGGAEATVVNLPLDEVGLSAHELGRFLEDQLRARLKDLKTCIDAL